MVLVSVSIHEGRVSSTFFGGLKASRRRKFTKWLRKQYKKILSQRNRVLYFLKQFAKGFVVTKFWRFRFFHLNCTPIYGIYRNSLLRFWKTKILNSRFWTPKSWIQHFGQPRSWIQDIEGPKSWYQDFGQPKCQTQVFGKTKSWLQDFGRPKPEFRILKNQNPEFKISVSQNPRKP